MLCVERRRDTTSGYADTAERHLTEVALARRGSRQCKDILAIENGKALSQNRTGKQGELHTSCRNTRGPEDIRLRCAMHCPDPLLDQ